MYGVNVRSAFKDFDKVNRGLVTKAQFERNLPGPSHFEPAHVQVPLFQLLAQTSALPVPGHWLLSRFAPPFLPVLSSCLQPGTNSLVQVWWTTSLSTGSSRTLRWKPRKGACQAGRPFCWDAAKAVSLTLTLMHYLGPACATRFERPSCPTKASLDLQMSWWSG
jgi:hypothetical protein